MTTDAAAAQYIMEHIAAHEMLSNAVFNPQMKPAEELPVIYGFNNGGPSWWLQGMLLAEDGSPLGGHICSSEAYMPADLGILDGTRPDLHEIFRKKYPGGYQMEFVPRSEMDAHAGLKKAISLCLMTEGGK